MFFNNLPSKCWNAAVVWLMLSGILYPFVIKPEERRFIEISFESRENIPDNGAFTKYDSRPFTKKDKPFVWTVTNSWPWRQEEIFIIWSLMRVSWVV